MQQRPLRRNTTTNTQLFTYIVILLILVGLIFTVGIPFVINTSLFVGQIGKTPETTPRDKKDDSIGFAPEIYDIPTATNEARIIFSGSAPEKAKLKLFVNDKEEDSIDLEKDGTFESTAVLKKGANSIYIEATYKNSKEKKKSEVYKVNYIAEKPTLNIESPVDGTKTSQNEVEVKGSTQPDTRVKINNQPIVLNSEGHFARKILLQEGDNQITVEVTDIAGNSDKKTLKVIYEKDF